MVAKYFDLLVKIDGSIVDIIDVGTEITYRKLVFIVQVDEGLDELVLHRYKVQHAWFDGDWVGPLRGFNGPNHYK